MQENNKESILRAKNDCLACRICGARMWRDMLSRRTARARRWAGRCMSPRVAVSSGACPLERKGTPAACEGAGVGEKGKGVCQNAFILLRLLRSHLPYLRGGA